MESLWSGIDTVGNATPGMIHRNEGANTIKTSAAAASETNGSY